jgi:hypothetical protein
LPFRFAVSVMIVFEILWPVRDWIFHAILFFKKTSVHPFRCCCCMLLRYLTVQLCFGFHISDGNLYW